MPLNYHFHDARSSDAVRPLGEHCAAAARAGFREVCVTNHVERMDDDGRWTVDLREAAARFREEAQGVERAGGRWPELRVLLGAEFEYRREWREPLEALAREVPLDFVIGSLHAVDGTNVSGGGDADRYFRERSREEAYRGYFEGLEEMVEWGGFDAVGHFDLVKRYGHLHHGPYRAGEFEEAIRRVLRRMAARGIGIEVNTSGVGQPPGRPYPDATILGWALEEGVPFLTLGSDSHAPGSFDQGLLEGVRGARRAGWQEAARLRRRRVVGGVSLEKCERHLAAEPDRREAE